jgi:exodeoxyribonuclease V beta subunit
MRVLNIPEVQLAGLQMIEASAGTGKTWTIAALYLRLLLERALPVEKILVVTYTNAATAELRARIRARLLEAQQACKIGTAGEDAVLADVFSRVPIARAQALLTLALESFDLASIHTIHGFCQRALAERAFESGLPFESALADDDRRVLHEAMEDFWRSAVVGRDADPLWLGWLLARLPGPQALLQQLAPQFGKPYLLHVPAPDFDAAVGEAFAACFARVRSVWQRDGAAAMELLRNDPNVNRVSLKVTKVDSLSQALDRWLAGAPTLACPKDAGKLASGGIPMKKDKPAPTHGVFDALAELLQALDAVSTAFEARLGHLRQQALQQCEDNVRAARQRLATRSFDDLLLDLHAALAGEGGDALAAALRERYAAALIDEFQDTDPLQYGIFSTVFIASIPAGQGRSMPQAAAGFCAFVGDPKQAIYSFRGADLQAYLEARSRAGEPLVLDTNRRSTASLITAVNTVFSRNPDPFRDAALGFDPVRAPATAPAPILLDGQPLPAMDIWFMPRAGKELEPRKSGDNKGKLGTIARKRANPAIAAAVAASIAQLLSASQAGRVTVDDDRRKSPWDKGVLRPLAGQDIAVLVKSHYQGQLVRTELQALGVASVRYGQESIFETPDALEVERVLLAIAHPAREGLVRSALATQLMGVRGDALAALDGAAWLQRLEDFHRWHVQARDQGFIRMWRSWQLEAGVAERLLALPDGERLMTNLQHLSDLLAALAHDDQLGIEALAKHLADARNDARSETNSGEGRLLRLESDENLVRIVTIHTSKGLEYPLTYCPFLWDGKQREHEGPVRYHDPAQGHRAALDFGSPALADHAALAAEESRAEALRLAYVALTRARQHCVLVWGALADAEASPLAWLLHGEDSVDFGSRSDAELRATLNDWHAACEHIVVHDLPEANAAMVEAPAEAHAPLAALPWPQRGLPPWRMHSFSAWLLNAAEAGVDEAPEHDAIAAVPLEAFPLSPDPSPSRGEGSEAHEVSKFPAGANAGTCLHAMFERADFMNPEPEVIIEALAEFGFEADLQPVAMALLSDALATPMGANLPALREIPLAQQIREMEFMLPLRAPDMLALAVAIGPDAGADGRLAERVRMLQPAHLGGFLKGFIDLVFMHEDRHYVLDYKSNQLGAHLRDYAQAQLAAAMAAAMYDLQALLYGVALHLALQQRLPDYDYERHCGGALYLFLRGMQPAVPGSGVFAWRPSREMVERVAACLMRRERVFL